MKKIGFFIFLFLLSPLAHAGGHSQVTSLGTPKGWNNSNTITIHPEAGDCGRYSNEYMQELLQEVLDDWSGASELDLTLELQSGVITSDIDTYREFTESFYGVDCDEDYQNCSYNSYVNYNPIIFDSTGDITAKLHGCASLGSQLGSTGITHASTTEGIERAAYVINCACFVDTADQPTCEGSNGETVRPCSTLTSLSFDSEEVLRATIQHEMGHFLGLDHTPVLDELFDDEDDTNDDNVPLMYPTFSNPDRNIDIKQDDIIAMAQLYPSSDFESEYCQITGTLVDRDSSANELQCASVEASTGDTSETIGFISGSLAEAVDQNGDGDAVDYISSTGTYECTDKCGDFKLYLKPGETYEITVNAIDTSYVGSKGVRPCDNEQLPACTTDLIANCYSATNQALCDAGSPACEECAPCVNDEILISSSTYESTYLSQCVAGATIDVGTISTSSISYTSSVVINGGEAPDLSAFADDGDAADSTSTTATCQLVATASGPSFSWKLLAFGILALLVSLRLNKTFQTKRIGL